MQCFVGEGISNYAIRNTLVSSNTYVVLGKKSKSAVVIDPGSSYKDLIATLESLGVKKIDVLLTHGHFDHVIGVTKLDAFDPTIFMSEADGYHLKKNNFYLKALKHSDRCEPFDFRDFSDYRSDSILDVAILGAPGHTRGSHVFKIGDAYYTGDTLYAKSVFAPTVKGTDRIDQQNSISEIFATANPGCILFPGHGGSATFESSLRMNLELQAIMSTKW